MSSPIRIVVSRNWADVRAGLAVAHETFVESGFQRPLPSGVRLLPSHLNPGTFIALGLLDGRPAAAVAVTADGPFGLASDRAFVEEIDELRTRYELLEVGSFGVHRWARQSATRLLSHLFSSLVRVLRTLTSTTYVLGAFDSSAASFHSRTFGFLPITPNQRPLYGTPARLLGGARRQIMTAIEEPGGLRSEIRLLAEELSPSWLTVNEGAPDWPVEEVALLLAESGELQRLDAQSEVVAPILAAYRGAVTEDGVPIAREHRWIDADRERPGRLGTGERAASEVPGDGDR